MVVSISKKSNFTGKAIQYTGNNLSEVGDFISDVTGVEKQHIRLGKSMAPTDWVVQSELLPSGYNVLSDNAFQEIYNVK